jgi:hypothetical protein
MRLTSEIIKSTWKSEGEWYQNPNTLRWLKIGYGVSIGDRVSIGNRVSIGDRVSIGNRVSIGDGVKLTIRDIVTISVLGSRKAPLTVILVPDITIYAGCFNDYKGGTIEQFRKAIIETHGDNKYGREYIATIEYIEKLAEIRKQA